MAFRAEINAPWQYVTDSGKGQFTVQKLQYRRCEFDGVAGALQCSNQPIGRSGSQGGGITSLDVSSFPATRSKTVTGSEFYRGMSELGYQWKGAFDVVDRFWAGGRYPE